MKKYADEVVIAFNGLEDRYTKLKNVCAASDAKNQVHSLSFFNAYLTQSMHLATTLITFLSLPQRFWVIGAVEECSGCQRPAQAATDPAPGFQRQIEDVRGPGPTSAQDP